MASQSLDAELLRFATEHPEGWDHEQWLALLRRLAENGYDVSNPDGIGLALERHRLVLVLERMEIQGLGPKRIEALAEHFGLLWNLMCASAEDVARVGRMPLSVAEQILDVLQ